LVFLPVSAVNFDIAGKTQKILKIEYFRKNQYKHSTVPPLVDPRAVEINIFVDLTISKEQKTIPEDLVF
jgi:hypothetical protein